MNTVNFVAILCFFFLAALGQAAEPVNISELPYKITCIVTDHCGAHVPGVRVKVYRQFLKEIEPYPLSGGALVDFDPTDADGKSTASCTSISPPAAAILSKDGYYPTWLRFDWKTPEKFDFNHPRTTELHAILKPIKNPIPMHASSNLGSKKIHVEIPRLDQAYGFDLKRCEPLPPLGKGEVADFHFKVTGFYRTRQDYDCRIEISFLNPGDGLVEFYTPLRGNMSEPNYLGSELQSDYEAPSEGYQSTTTRADRLGPDTPFVQGFKDRRNFYFRCRTKKDASGKIISAHYGKIYGDIKFLAGDPAMGSVGQFNWTCSYFNPTPNDRNVEFDTKRNLNPDFEVSWP